MIAVLTVVGPGGLWLLRRSGLPAFWSPRGSLARPLPWGIALGLLAIGTDLLTGWTAVVARKLGMASIHIDFPASLLIYPGGAIIVNAIYYLVPIPLLVWLISGVLLKGRHREPVFWTVGALAAAIEPLTQDLGYPGPAWVMLLLLAEDYALNLAQVALLRRDGFLATVLLRVSFYLVWHVAWGALG